MTNRSFYLDDMDIAPGQRVRCKSNLCADWIAEGETFILVSVNPFTLSGGGELFVNPSARFQKVE